MQFVRHMYMRARIACTVIKNVNYESLAATSHNKAFVSEEVGSDLGILGKVACQMPR
jgi:hypothetical protein